MVARLLRVFGYVLAGLGLFIFIQLPVLADGYWNWWGERPQQINIGYHWVALVVLTVGVAVVLVRCYHHYFEMPVLLGPFSWSMMGLTALVAVVVVVIQMGISGLLVSPTETQNDEIMALIHSPLGLLTLWSFSSRLRTVCKNASSVAAGATGRLFLGQPRRA